MGSGRPIAVLVVVSAALTALSLVGQLLVRSQAVQASWFVTLAAGFDLDHEVNVPSWFQTGLLLLCAAVLWTVADDVNERGLARSRYWRALCVVFLYLSLDELVSLHERVNVPLSSTLHLGGALTFSWVLLATPLLVVLAALYGRLLLELLPASRRRILLAGTLYVLGAYGVELVGGELYSLGDAATVKYALVTTVEEVLEMSGLVLFLRALDLHRQHLAR